MVNLNVTVVIHGAHENKMFGKTESCEGIALYYSHQALGSGLRDAANIRRCMQSHTTPAASL